MSHNRPAAVKALLRANSRTDPARDSENNPEGGVPLRTALVKVSLHPTTSYPPNLSREPPTYLPSPLTFPPMDSRTDPARDSENNSEGGVPLRTALVKVSLQSTVPLQRLQPNSLHPTTSCCLPTYHRSLQPPAAPLSLSLQCSSQGEPPSYHLLLPPNLSRDPPTCMPSSNLPTNPPTPHIPSNLTVGPS